MSWALEADHIREDVVSMRQKTILVVGDYGERAPYHPLDGVDTLLTRTFSEYLVSCTGNYDAFQEDFLRDYDMCISYLDCWDGGQARPDALSDSQVGGLLCYVAGGGKLLNLHTGIADQGRYELAQLNGAYFTGHPPMRELVYQPRESRHPALRGVREFTLQEEPYQFDFRFGTPVQMLMEYTYEGNRYPAMWEHSFGLGKVVYFQPGHTPQNLEHPMVQKILVQLAAYLTR